MHAARVNTLCPTMTILFQVLDPVTTIRTNLTAELEEDELNRRMTLRDYSPYNFFKEDVTMHA